MAKPNPFDHKGQCIKLTSTENVGGLLYRGCVASATENVGNASVNGHGGRGRNDPPNNVNQGGQPRQASQEGSIIRHLETCCK